MSTPTNDTYRWTRILMPACILWKFPQASKAIAHADKNVRTCTTKRKWSGLNAPSNWKLCYLVWTYESVGKSLCTDGAQTVPRRSPAKKHTVPDHFKIHKGRFPNPFLRILKWSGTVCFCAGHRLGSVWAPSGDRLGIVACWSFVTSTQETLLCELKPSPSLHYSPHLDARKFHLPIT